MGAMRDFLEGIKENVIEAVQPENIMQDVGAEFGRLAVQGQMELASAIYNGSSFVPYGPGQITPDTSKEAAAIEAAPVEPTVQPEQNQGIEM